MNWDWPPALDTVRTWIAMSSAAGAILTAGLLAWVGFWRSFLGKMLFFAVASQAITFTLISFARMTGRGRDDLLFAIVYTILSAGIWGMFIAFLRVKHRGGLV